MHRDITRKLDEQREQLIFVKRFDFTTINSRQGTEFRSVYLQFRYSSYINYSFPNCNSKRSKLITPKKSTYYLIQLFQTY